MYSLIILKSYKYNYSSQSMNYPKLENVLKTIL